MMIMLIGLLGTVFCVGAYGLLTFERITANSITFHGLNMVGAVLLLTSIAYDFDWGDFGGVLIEVCWIVISVFGLTKLLLNSKREDVYE